MLNWLYGNIVICATEMVFRYYFFCFKQKYYRSNYWNYKITKFWFIFSSVYSLIFISMFDCWTFLVYKRSIADILLSIIFTDVNENNVGTTLETNSKINLFYTKVMVSEYNLLYLNISNNTKGVKD